MWIENRALCTLCPWAESWTTRDAAQAAAVWHVYNDHHDIWLERMGTPDRLPVDKMPADLGRRLEPWESQA